MDNKYLWLFIGIAAGYYLAKRKADKKFQAHLQEMEDKTTDEIAGLIDQALAVAEQKGLTVAQVRAEAKSWLSPQTTANA